jgi:hypothetical protein
VEKHNPFIHYEGIRNDPDRCKQIVPYSQLAGDLAALPNFVWITPNMCDDMHDECDAIRSAVKVGDDWLKLQVPLVLASPSCIAPQRCLIVITFDEGNTGQPPPGDNLVLTIFLRGGDRGPDSDMALRPLLVIGHHRRRLGHPTHDSERRRRHPDGRHVLRGPGHRGRTAAESPFRVSARREHGKAKGMGASAHSLVVRDHCSQTSMLPLSMETLPVPETWRPRPTPR